MNMQIRMKVGVFCLSLILLMSFAQSGSAKTGKEAVKYGSKLLTPLLRDLGTHDNTLPQILAQSIDSRMFPLFFALCDFTSALPETKGEFADLKIPVRGISKMLRRHGLSVDLNPRLNEVTVSELIEKAKKEFVRMLEIIERSISKSEVNKEDVIVFASLLYIRALLEAPSHVLRLNSKKGQKFSLNERVHAYTRALYAVSKIMDPVGYPEELTVSSQIAQRESIEEQMGYTASELVEFIGNYFSTRIEDGIEDFESEGAYFPMNLLAADTVAAIVYPLIGYYREWKSLGAAQRKITDLSIAVSMGARALHSLGFIFTDMSVNMEDNPMAWLATSSKGRQNRWNLTLKATGLTNSIQVTQGDLDRFLPGGPD